MMPMWHAWPFVRVRKAADTLHDYQTAAGLNVGYDVGSGVGVGSPGRYVGAGVA